MTSTTNQQTGSPPGTGGVKDAAREEAAHLRDTAADAGREVAGTAREKTSDVASDLQRETQRLMGQTREQVGRQAGQQRDQAVDTLRSLGDELREMAQHGSGWGAQLARQAASWTDQTAGFLDGREPADILEDLRGFARRRPGRFLAGAVVAGIVAGRMSRAMASGASGNGGTQPSGGDGANVRRTGDDSPVHPRAAGETSPAAAADPTVAPGDTLPGQPTGASAEMPRPEPTPTAPDLDPGAPVQPRFGPGTGQ